jgi:hypothetical protein
MLRVLRASAAPVLRTPAVRAGFAALPVVSLGLLCPVPSLVLALRRRTRADWLAFAGFTAVLAAWITELALTPVDTHGALFGVDLLLVTLSMAGASAHAWRAWPRRAGDLAAGRAGGPTVDRAESREVDRAEGLGIDRPQGLTADRAQDLTAGRALDLTAGRAQGLTADRVQDLTSDRAGDPVVERAEE